MSGEDAGPELTETPVPDSLLSPGERYATLFLLAIAGITLAALIGAEVAPGNALSETLQTYFIDPVTIDSTGDSGYNIVDTIVYSVTLVTFVVVLSAWLRRSGIPATDRALLALLPWVVWAAFGEVNEDAQLFSAGISQLFISPLIHFQVAIWVILTGILCRKAGMAADEDAARSAVTRVSVSLVVVQAAIFLPQFIDEWTLTLTSPLLWMPLVGLGLVFALQPLLACRHTPMEQGLVQTGVGGVAIHAAAWLNFMCDPLVDANGILAEPVGFTPVAVVIGVPLLVCIILYRIGRESAEELYHIGLEPGIIPRGITLDDWDRQHSSTHERMEALTPRALLASSVLLAAIFGQIADGLATWLGIDVYALYEEKHVLSNLIIEWGGGDLSGTGGAWLFLAVKVGLAALVWALFAMARFEVRHRHLRQLIILCILVVGLAPGLRDMLRLSIGV